MLNFLGKEKTIDIIEYQLSHEYFIKYIFLFYKKKLHIYIYIHNIFSACFLDKIPFH